MIDREELGKLVRKVWMEWAREQLDAKQDWLDPWETLSPRIKDVDCRIGEAVQQAVLENMKNGTN
jgi:hypothetical protein